MRTILLSILLVACAVPAFAQPPAEACGPGDSFDGTDMFPLGITATPMSDDFTMTGTSCSELGADHVTCFTPESSCTVNMQCEFDPDPVADESVLGVSFAINLFTGGCAASPASCVASASGPGIGSLNGVSLTGGTDYCIVCETDDPSPTATRLIVNTTAGDCGALPVDVESFTID